MKITRKKTLIVVASAAMFCAGVSLAQQEPPLTTASIKPKEAAKARHDGFEEIDDAFEHLEKASKKSTLDALVVERYANRIDALAKDSVNWFPPGSGPGNGFKTKALPEVWTQNAAFHDLQNKFLAAAAKLAQAAPSATPAALHAEVDALGEACSNCHKKFRKQTSIWSLFGGD